MDDKAAFIKAITKLADDAEFRKAFLQHYQLWLHPPLLVDPGLVDLRDLDFRPGAVTFLTEKQRQALHFLHPEQVSNANGSEHS